MIILYELITPHSKLPEKATLGSVGYDLFSVEDVTLLPGKRAVIGTGIVLDLKLSPPGSDVTIRPRSGLAAKHGVTVLNSPGTIDRDYLGELKVILINHGEETYYVRIGDRIAQLVTGSTSAAVFFPVHGPIDSDTTKRGAGGFGSTGY